jgi:hypothetical protein
MVMPICASQAKLTELGSISYLISHVLSLSSQGLVLPLSSSAAY